MSFPTNLHVLSYGTDFLTMALQPPLFFMPPCQFLPRSYTDLLFSVNIEDYNIGHYRLFPLYYVLHLGPTNTHYSIVWSEMDPANTFYLQNYLERIKKVLQQHDTLMSTNSAVAMQLAAAHEQALAARRSFDSPCSFSFASSSTATSISTISTESCTRAPGGDPRMLH